MQTPPFLRVFFLTLFTVSIQNHLFSMTKSTVVETEESTIITFHHPTPETKKPHPKAPSPQEIRTQLYYQFYRAVKNRDMKKAQAIHRQAEAISFNNMIWIEDPVKGWTPLHVAAYNGDPDMITFLLGIGAFVNAQTKKGATPLHFAMQRGFTLTNAEKSMPENYRHTIEILRNKYASAELRDITEKTPDDYATDLELDAVVVYKDEMMPIEIDTKSESYFSIVLNYIIEYVKTKL